VNKYIIYPEQKIKPVIRLSFIFQITKGNRAADEISITHRSILKKDAGTGTSATKAVPPIMANKLNILLPITLPNATSP
jgi:hypothetical protein